jgi:hypothetical protein
VAFSISGRRGSFPVTPAMVTVDPSPPFHGSTLQVTLALGASASNIQCGSVFYNTVQLTRCTFSASGNRVTCSGPPPVGPCHVGDPVDLMICDVVNAAHAEDEYFAAQGVYFTGPCTGLPGFVPSPGVTCYAAGSATAFDVLSTQSAEAPFTCEWLSNAPPTTDKLVCY